MDVPVGFVPTSSRTQTVVFLIRTCGKIGSKMHIPLGLMRGPKALKNHQWLFYFFLFCYLRQNKI